MSEWSVVYKRAINDDGSLFFPERLTQAFLDDQKEVMGSYMFANQYQNEIIPLDEQRFKPNWFKKFEKLPDRKHTFAFIDPALSESASADNTALIVLDVDIDCNWYVRLATRYRINPTEIVNLIFSVNKEFKPMSIGVESVAFQKALIYMANEEMKRRGTVVPLAEVKPSPEKTKEMRISSLVPRYEFGRIYHAQGLVDLETELLQFPRARHDDLSDALASITEIIVYPRKERPSGKPPHQLSPEYEKWYRENLARKSPGGGFSGD